MQHSASLSMVRQTAACIATVLACLWLVPAPTFAQDAVVEPVSKHRDWTVYKFKDGGSDACFITSAAKTARTEPRGRSRGAVTIQVTHRPGAGTFDEVSYASGYPFQDDSTVRASIGSQRFNLFTSGSTAWTTSTGEDEKLVRAMKAGATMRVQGTSSRGAKSNDTFSLSGFTAAYNAMNRICSR